MINIKIPKSSQAHQTKDSPKGLPLSPANVKMGTLIVAVAYVLVAFLQNSKFISNYGEMRNREKMNALRSGLVVIGALAFGYLTLQLGFKPALERSQKEQQQKDLLLIQQQKQQQQLQESEERGSEEFFD